MTTTNDLSVRRSHQRTCKVTKKNGEPCKGLAMLGQDVCRSHGGASPQARAKAQERINAAADSAAGHLIKWMNDPKVPFPTRLAAAKDLLDRAQIGTDKKVGFEITQKPFEIALAGILIDVSADDDIVEAEVVEDSLPALPSGAKVRRRRSP